MTTFAIPDRLPMLAKGHQPEHSGKGCAMDMLSWLTGRKWGDRLPDCVHPVINEFVVTVNDLCEDESRQRLWPLLLRCIGTAAPDDQVLDVRLAAWLAESVLDLTRLEDRQACANAIATARAWADDPATDVAYAGANAAKAAAYAAAYAGAYAAGAFAYCAAYAPERLIATLEGLLNYHCELTNHVPPPVAAERWASLCEAMSA